MGRLEIIHGTIIMKTFDVSNLIKLYLSGKTLQQVADQAEVSSTTILRWFHEKGVKLRSRSETAIIRTRGTTRIIISAETLQKLEARYLSGKTCPQLSEEFGIPRNTIYKNLKRIGVRFRDNRQELAKAQSRANTNKKRSLSCKRRFARMTAEERSSYFLKAAEPKRGKRQSFAQKVSIAIGRQKNLSPRSSPEEFPIIGSLEALGYKTSPQLAAGPYNLDIALKKLGVAVEVDNGNALGATGRYSKRLKYLLNHGWSVLFIITRNNKLVFPNLTKKILAFFEAAGRDKPFHGQYGVIRGDGEVRTRCCSNFDGFPRVPGF